MRQSPAATVAQMEKHPNWVITLRDAINIADNSPTPGGNVIVLKHETYQLRDVDNNWYGPNGLPAITSNVTIQGHGASIEREGDTNFRFFYIASTKFGGASDGTLTLQNLTLKNGFAQGGESYQGGGGLGAGGAIFNQGALVLDRVTMKDNTARGGNVGNYETITGSHFARDWRRCVRDGTGRLRRPNPRFRERRIDPRGPGGH